MAQIFVSHSQLDEEIRKSFDSVFARTTVKSVCMEFEKLYPPHWEHIKSEIVNSSAVFLLLGPNVRISPHTQNWIAFEVGVACALVKSVWVFEEQGSHIQFPIPYLTDYMIYDLKDETHFDYVRNIIEGYGRPPVIFPLNVDLRTKRRIPHGSRLEHNIDNCMSQFALHTKIRDFYCPSCRQLIQLSENH